MALSPMEERHKFYLTYLDKEMTIMGILSTFCAAVLAAVLKIYVDTGCHDETLRRGIVEKGYSFLAAGCVATAMAMWSFYNQRGRLAYYYGQISIWLARADDKKCIEAIDESDNWQTWFPYY